MVNKSYLKSFSSLLYWSLFVLCFKAFEATAYIPNHRMILSRVAENNGRGAYFIEQELLIESGIESIRFTEKWVIQSEHRMSVEVASTLGSNSEFSGHIVYDANYRYFLNSQGNLTKAPLSSDWWMPFFHFRFSKNMIPKMAEMGLLAPDTAETADNKEQLSDYSTEAESFLRLSRSGGSVNYAFGTPSMVEARPLLPGLWVEQDRFVIRKLRLPSEAVVTASDYQNYPRFQHLPKQTQVNWDNHSVKINLIKVLPLNANHPLTRQLSSEFLRSKNSAASSATPIQLPEIAVVRDFFTRFR